jgi:maltose/moltooligosaccharide transporter
MKFRYGKIFLLGFGSFGFSMLWIIYNAFVPLFLQERFGLQPGWIGFFMTLDNIAALLIQPSIGAFSDRLRTPLGRRMPFILAGAPVAALAFGLLPLTAALPVFVACAGALLLSMAFWRTPVVALMADITPSQYRSQANGITNLMGGLGAILGTLGGSALYALNPAYPFWMGAVAVVVAALMVLLFVKEPAVPAPPDEEPSLWRSLQAIQRDADKSVGWILAAMFAWLLAYSALEAFFSLYVKNHLGLPGSDGARLLGQFSLLLVICALPAGIIGGKLGRRKSLILGLLVIAPVFLTIYLLPPDILTFTLTRLPVLGTVPVIGVLLMVLGSVWALVNVNVLPMILDMTDDAHIGTYTGLYYLSFTLAAVVGPNLNGWIVQFSGNNYAMIMLASLIFTLAALGMMRGVRRGEVKTGAQL